MVFLSSLHRRRLSLGVLICSGLWAVPAVAEDVSRAPVVTVVAAVDAEMIDQVPIAGTLVPRDEVLIFPQVSGYTIDALTVDIGDSVTRGDVLARLNKDTLEAQLSQAAAEFARAEASVGQAQSQIASARASLQHAVGVLIRAEKLRESGTGSQAALEQASANQQTAKAAVASATDGLAVAEAQMQVAQAQVDVAQLTLEHATILAPVDGLIVDRKGRLGAIATSGGDPIFRLNVGGNIEVEAEVVETAISRLQEGNSVLLDISGIGPVAGKVRLISPVVDPVTRLGLVRVSTNGRADLRAGLFASGWIITSQRTTLTVPAPAVLTDVAGTFVLRVDDNTIERRAVTAGLIWQGKREIVAGLDAGDVVVAKAGAFFADGDVIAPTMADQPEASE